MRLGPPLCVLMTLAATIAAGTTYYVDSAGGNDANTGTAPERAWKSVRKVSGRYYGPGDKILLKAGSVWNGEQLYPKGSGAAHAPIIIDQYGTGPKPVINANVAHEAAVQLVNQEYWEINNLEITNARDLTRPADVGNHVGILLMIENESRVFRHLNIANCHIHDVDGDPNFQGADDKTTGGIGGRIRAEKGQAPGHFEDVRIENNRIERVSRSGIFLFSSRDIYSTSREPKGFVRDFMTFIRPADDWHEEFYSRDLYVAGNTIDRAAGDGIVIIFTRGALVERNTVTRSSDRSSAPCAGIWTCYSSQVVVQYNEVAHITNAKDDGTAFDFDCGSRDVIYQYNYSHHNQGGWMLLMKNAPDANLVARYNISAFESMGKTWDTPDNSLMHNNVFYRNECASTQPRSSELIGFKTAYNNLFIECRKIGYWRKDNDGVHDHNAYINSGGNHGEAHAVTGEPRLVGPLPAHGIGDGFAACAAFKLTAGSPCQNAGRTIPKAGDRDFFGNQLRPGNPDIGAHELSGRKAAEWRPKPRPPLASAPPPEPVGYVNRVGGGQASASASLYDTSAASAFDQDVITKWIAPGPAQWLQYAFADGQRVRVSRYTITASDYGRERDPLDWSLKGSNDGLTWATLDTRRGVRFNAPLEKRSFDIAQPEAFAIYRLDITNTPNGTPYCDLRVAEVELLEQDRLVPQP